MVDEYDKPVPCDKNCCRKKTETCKLGSPLKNPCQNNLEEKSCWEIDQCCEENGENLQCTPHKKYINHCKKYKTEKGCENHHKNNDDEWHKGHQHCFWHENDSEDDQSSHGNKGYCTPMYGTCRHPPGDSAFDEK